MVKMDDSREILSIKLTFRWTEFVLFGYRISNQNKNTFFLDKDSEVYNFIFIESLWICTVWMFLYVKTFKSEWVEDSEYSALHDPKGSCLKYLYLVP